MDKFNIDDIFDYYKAYAITDANEDDFLTGDELLAMNNEEALDKYDSLSTTDKAKFDKKLQTAVKKNKDLFGSLPEYTNDEDDLMEYQNIIRDIVENLEKDFEEFLH